MMGPMSDLHTALGGRRVFVEFPTGGVQEWVAAAEVLIQEGLAAFCLGRDQLELLPDALALVGRRARVGVHGLTDAAGVRAAVAAGAHFLTSPVADPALVDAAGDVLLVAGALTPTEVAAAARAGAGAVQVVPADVLGAAYARVLPGLLPGVPLVATGRLERFQADMWLQAGARAVGLTGVVLAPESGPQGRPNDLEDVRRRARGFGQLGETS